MIIFFTKLLEDLVYVGLQDGGIASFCIEGEVGGRHSSGTLKTSAEYLAEIRCGAI